MEYRIWFPNEARNSVYAREVLEFGLVERFGGFTKSNATGGWRNAEGRVEKEPVTVYTAIRIGAAPVGDPDGTDENFMQGLADFVRERCEQEAVLWDRRENEAWMVTATTKAARKEQRA